MIKFYRHPLSGNAHRVELFLNMANIEHQMIDVDLIAGEHKQATFIAKNPFGQVPVIEDGDVTLSESTVILTYLAKKFTADQWLHQDPVLAAEVQRWLSITDTRIQQGPAAARLVTLFNAPYDHQQRIDSAHAFLTVLDSELADKQWLVDDTFGLAEIATYAYIAHAPEGGVSLAAYNNIRNWLARIEAQPNFIGMQRSPDLCASDETPLAATI